ncbi:MAG: LysE family transporter [Bacteroidia bacterium]|nr:LysE family transporter [Bacteroidia bacterium]
MCSEISNFVDKQQFYLRLIGGLVLLTFGIRIYLTNTIKQVRNQKVNKVRSFGDFFTVLFVTISNPLTFLFFGAVFTGLGLVSHDSMNFSSIALVGGVMTGTVIWWLSLSTIINVFRYKIRLRSLWWINKIAGALISVIGIIAVLSIFFIHKTN